MTASTKGSGEALHGYQPGLTIGQVASMLKVSPSTVRRWVRSGKLLSAQVTVGDGFEYRIDAEALERVKASMNPSAEPFANPATVGSVLTVLEASVERSTAVAAYNAQLLAPLVAVIERQAAQLVTQAETIGELRARLDAQQPQEPTLDASGATQGPEPSTGGPGFPEPFRSPATFSAPWWRPWWPLAVLLVAMVVAGVLLTVPR